MKRSAAMECVTTSTTMRIVTGMAVTAANVGVKPWDIYAVYFCCLKQYLRTHIIHVFISVSVDMVIHHKSRDGMKQLQV